MKIEIENVYNYKVLRVMHPGMAMDDECFNFVQKIQYLFVWNLSKCYHEGGNLQRSVESLFESEIRDDALSQAYRSMISFRENENQYDER